MTTVTPFPAVPSLRSIDTGWNYERWSALPDDGNRYEVIDGVLFVTTAPSFFTSGSFARSCCCWWNRLTVRALV